MTRLEKLQLTEVPAVVEFLHVEKFPGINDGLHHHVFHPTLRGQTNDGFAILDRSRHRHGAGDVLSCPHGLQGGFRMVRDWGIDMDRIDIRILKKRLVLGESLCDSIFVGDLVQVFLIPLTQGYDFSIGMPLVDRNEFGAESQSDDCYFWFFDTHGVFAFG